MIADQAVIGITDVLIVVGGTTVSYLVGNGCERRANEEGQGHQDSQQAAERNHHKAKEIIVKFD